MCASGHPDRQRDGDCDYIQYIYILCSACHASKVGIPILTVLKGITSRGTNAAVVGEASCVPCVAATFRAPPLLPLPRNWPSLIQLEHLRLLLNFFAFNSHGSHVPFPFFRFGGALSVVIIALLLLLLRHSPSAQLTVHLPAAISHLHFGAEGKREKNEGKPINCPGGLSIDRPQAPRVVYLIEWHNHTHTHTPTHLHTPAHTHTSRAFII